MKYEKEINRRKTFAIISQPDAGGKNHPNRKIALIWTGAIQVAGAVKVIKSRNMLPVTLWKLKGSGVSLWLLP
jgi:peptide subunit release factor RF-3